MTYFFEVETETTGITDITDADIVRGYAKAKQLRLDAERAEESYRQLLIERAAGRTEIQGPGFLVTLKDVPRKQIDWSAVRVAANIPEAIIQRFTTEKSHTRLEVKYSPTED